MEAKKIQDGSEPSVAEAEAILWALSFARDLKLEHFIVESDCLSVIMKLRRRVVENGVIGVLIGRCLDIASSCGSMSWPFVKRSSNEAANHLAQIMPSFNFIDFDLHSFPAGLLHLVSLDIA